MRLIGKLLLKLLTLVVTVLLMGTAVRYGQRYMIPGDAMPSAGGESARFSSEEADLMSTVFKSAIRLLSGTASRDELAGELSDKIYAGQADDASRAELGIELVRPGDKAPLSGGDKRAARVESSDQSPAKMGLPHGRSLAEGSANDRRKALLDRYWAQAKIHSIELFLVPVVLLGMVLIRRTRRRSPADDLAPSALSMLPPAEIGPYDMTHAVHSLEGEDFELLVARIYQRQGYRILMPAGLGGGRGGSFTVVRKSERLLVQCKRFNADHKVPMERVRELQEAVNAAGATRGLYVAPCGFTWDARNYAKANGVRVIDARTLDSLIATVRETPDEDPLAVSQWAPKFMSKVELKTPHCPSCEAEMDQLSVSHGTVWVCRHRPDCRGRRSARKYLKQPEPARAA